MLPERYSTLTYGYILLSLTGFVNSECRHYFTADHSVRTFRSQHTTSGERCTYYIQSHGSSTSNISIRIYFPCLDPLPYHICIGTHVDVYDGFNLVGKYCDMNSTLIQSSQENLTLKSRTSGATFDFQVVYCLHPFSKPPNVLFRENPPLHIEPKGLPPIWTAAISIAVFLFIFIFGCLVNKYCNPCKQRERSGSQETRGGNSAVVFSAGPPAYSTLSTTNANDRSELAPPANHQSVYVNPIFDPDPPPYWSVYAAGRPALGKSYPDTPPSYEFATAHPS